MDDTNSSVASAASFLPAIPRLQSFVDVANAAAYARVPDSWRVVVTDVVGSTRAIESGRYRDVNAVGVASIVAVRNALRPALGEAELPYVFGGDGASMLAPESLIEPISRALRSVRDRARGGLGLELRIGAVPVEELSRDGFEIRVASLATSLESRIWMLAGEGVLEAERRIKDPLLALRHAIPAGDSEEPDLQGLECRWRPVKNRHGAAVSLLVRAIGPDSEERQRCYQRVISALELLVGGDESCPVAVETLELERPARSFRSEARLRAEPGRRFALWERRLRAWIAVLAGRALFATRLRDYRQQLVANTDFRKFDETLRMTLDLSPEQLAELEALLDEEHRAGCVVFGLHTAPATLVTCMIDSYRGKHFHFVDGDQGGYAVAAKRMRRQLEEH